MAVTPLFLANTATLLSKLRLTGVKGDGAAIVDEVIQQVRLGFYDFLGTSRVAAIVAITASDTPATEDELTRFRANLAESMWTRLLLMRRLPMLFMDASDKTQEIWDQEGLTRYASRVELDAEVERLERELNDLLNDLTGEEEPDESTINVMVIEPSCTPPRPGDTAFGRGRYIGRNIWPERGDTNNM